MKEKELAKFVDWLVQSGESPEGASFDETISWINELATSEEGQQILGRLIQTYKNQEMGIFKEGGKLHQLLCFKTGGKGPDCGCNKIKKAWGGTKMTNYITDDDVRALQNGTYRKSYTDEFGNKIEARPAVWKNRQLGNGITYMAVTPQNDTLYRTVGFDLEPSDKEGMQEVIPWGGSYDLNYYKDDSNWKRSQNYYPRVINTIKSIPPMMQSGGEISRRDALNILRTTGSSNSESRREYRDAKREARQFGLRGDEMRDSARAAIMARGVNRILPALSDDIEIEDVDIDVPVSQFELPEQTSLGITIQDYNDKMNDSWNFNKAFGQARKYGLKEFSWRGKRYNTKLASSNPKPKPKSTSNQPQIITSETPSYPVYMPENKKSFVENLKAAILNNALYMK